MPGDLCAGAVGRKGKVMTGRYPARLVTWTAVLALSAAGCGLRTPGTPEAAAPGRARLRPPAPSVTEALAAAADSPARTARGQLLSAGPRFGLVWVTENLLLSLEQEHGGESPITAWGWQFEYQFEASAGAPIGLVEFVPMLAGLEWGLVLPSLSIFAGIRLPGGAEFVVGPYYSVATESVGLGLAAGYTFRAGDLSFPVNVSVTRNQNGERIGLTLGFNLRQ